MWGSIEHQARAVRQIRLLLGSTNTPILLTGREGVGKHLTAKVAARFLLCKGNQEAACACVSCKLFASSAHPDFLHVQPEGKTETISVEAVRDIVDRLQSFPNLGRYVVLLEGAHCLTPSATDGLLKTLEEHPKNTWFLSVTDDPTSLPFSFLSRHRQVAFNPLPASYIETRLSGSKGEVSLYARMAEGSLGVALQCQKTKQIHVRDRVVDLLRFHSTGDFSSILGVAEQEVKGDLSFAIRWLGQLIVDGSLTVPRIHTDIAGTFPRLEYRSLWDPYQDLKKAAASSAHTGYAFKAFFLRRPKIPHGNLLRRTFLPG